MKLFYILAVLGWSVSAVWAGEVPPPQPAEVSQPGAQTPLAALAARFNAVQTIRSRFVQEKQMAMLTEPLVSTGSFVFTRTPAQLRWEYQTPFQNGFLITDGQSFRLDKGQKQPLKNKLATQVAQQMFVWLAFDVQTLSKTYRLDPFDGGMKLTPLAAKNSPVAAISVWFAPDNPQAVSRIEMTEPNGDKTVLRFSDTHINEPLPEGAFE